MLGNVAEITVSYKAPYGFAVKGGFWFQTMAGPETCHYSNTTHSPIFNSYEFGFRCAHDLK